MPDKTKAQLKEELKKLKEMNGELSLRIDKIGSKHNEMLSEKNRLEAEVAVLKSTNKSLEGALGQFKDLTDSYQERYIGLLTGSAWHFLVEKWRFYRSNQ